MAIVVQHPKAVEAMRSLIGGSDCLQAGSLRHRFATQQQRNGIHATDRCENVEREILLFFQENEILKFDDPLSDSIYEESTPELFEIDLKNSGTDL
ncbi:MAG: hypothetical protein MHPSP_001987 [Paramarteilia canceri]